MQVTIPHGVSVVGSAILVAWCSSSANACDLPGLTPYEPERGRWSGKSAPEVRVEGITRAGFHLCPGGLIFLRFSGSEVPSYFGVKIKAEGDMPDSLALPSDPVGVFNGELVVNWDDHRGFFLDPFDMQLSIEVVGMTSATPILLRVSHPGRLWAARHAFWIGIGAAVALLMSGVWRRWRRRSIRRA